MTECKACATNMPLSSSYCQNCGAKVVSERLTIKRLINKLFQNTFNLDFKFYRTLRGLIIHPEQITDGYVNGLRKKYNSPIQFAVIILGIYGLYQFFYSSFLDKLVQENLLSGIQSGWNEKNLGSEVNDGDNINSLINWMQKQYQFLIFFGVPLMGYFNMKLYKSKKYNLAEHIVVVIYAISFSVLLVIILGFLMTPFKSEAAFDFYLISSFLIQVTSIVWVVQRTLKGPLYKQIVSISASFLAWILLFIFILILFSLS